MTLVTVIGLGEAGALYATGLHEAGAVVHGYDPFISVSSPHFRQFDDLAAAVAMVDVVISLVGAAAAPGVANSVFPHLAGKTVFADFNTSSPGAKVALASAAATAGIRFADVAVLAPVGRSGSRTHLLASGDGAGLLAGLLQPLGVPIEVIVGGAGIAASRKLLRSVFMKGLAGLVLETVAAGEASHNEVWIRGQIAAELGPDGHALIERLISGSRAHAERRVHEVEDASEYLRELGTPGWMTEGTHQWLSSLTKGIK